MPLYCFRLRLGCAKQWQLLLTTNRKKNDSRKFYRRKNWKFRFNGEIARVNGKNEFYRMSQWKPMVFGCHIHCVMCIGLLSKFTNETIIDFFLWFINSNSNQYCYWQLYDDKSNSKLIDKRWKQDNFRHFFFVCSKLNRIMWP